MVPIIDPKGLAGAIFDPLEGNLDPNRTTYAYAAAARKRGAEILTHDRVHTLERTADGWRLETDRGRIEAEHVVNAAGLWARRVGRMVGVDHPLVPMVHHYLVTEPIPEVAAIEGDMAAVTDLEGFTYLQREGDGVLLGVYERHPRHWMVGGAEWAEVCLAPEAAAAITRPIHDALTKQVPAGGQQRPVPATPAPRAAAEERARGER
jgi:dimethylglycine dehydrogenase